MIRRQSDSRKDEIGDEPNDPVRRRDSPQTTDERSLSPVHGVLQTESFAVRFVRQTEQLFDRVTGDVGVGTSGEGLLDLLAERHAVKMGASTGQRIYRASSVVIPAELTPQPR